MGNKNTWQEETSLHDHDEEASGITRHLQMGLRYTPLKNYIWQISLTHLHRGSCFPENFSNIANGRSCKLKQVRRAKLKNFCFSNKSYFLRDPEARTENYCHLIGSYELVDRSAISNLDQHCWRQDALCIVSKFLNVGTITPFLIFPNPPFPFT